MGIFCLTIDFVLACVCTVIDHRRHSVERKKSTAQDEVECRDFLFFPRYDVFCDLRTTVHTHAKTKSICFIHQVM